MKPSNIFRSKRKSHRDYITSVLPLYNQKSCCRSTALNLISRRIFIHIIPVIVLFCLIILCWFSNPVSLAIRDGEIFGFTYPDVNEMPEFINETRVDFAFLAAISTPPCTSISHTQPVNNQNIEELVNRID